MNDLRYNKIENKPWLIKDLETNAVVNSSSQAYRAARERKKRYKENLQLKDELKTLQLQMLQFQKQLSHLK